MKFSDIKGHIKNISTLIKMHDEDRIFHSYLFTGIEGCGKKLVALAISKRILCLNKKGDDCECESCRMFDRDVHPDFKLVNLFYQASLLDEDVSEQNNLKISTIREVIRFSQLAPSFSSKKIIIIDDAYRMVQEAQNALLKTIEEPTLTSIFILITPSKNLLLPTVVSRCQVINFSPLTNDDVKEILIKNGYDEKTAAEAAISSCGSASFAIKHIDMFKEIRESIEYGSLAPFVVASKIIKSDNSKQSVLSLIDILNNRIYNIIKENPKEPVIEKAVAVLKKNLSYKNYLRYNVNPRIISLMTIYNYFMFRRELKELNI